jgi:hypothetical protein
MDQNILYENHPHEYYNDPKLSGGDLIDVIAIHQEENAYPLHVEIP